MVCIFRIFRGLALCVGMLCAAGWGGMARGEPARSPAPLEAFGRLPSVDLVVLSPTGDLVASIVRYDTLNVMQVRNSLTHALVDQLVVGPIKVRSLIWIDEDHLVILQSQTRDVFGLIAPRSEWLLGLEVDLKAKRSFGLLQDIDRHRIDVETMNVLGGVPTVATPSPGVHDLIIPGISFPNRRGTTTLFLAEGSGARILATGAYDTVGFHVGPSGAVTGRVDYENRTGAWTVRAGLGVYGLKVVRTGFNLTSYPLIVGSSTDGFTLYCRGLDNDAEHYFTIDLTSGQVTQAPDWFTRGELVIDPASHIVLAVKQTSPSATTWRFLDEADDKLWRGIVKAFPAASVAFESMSADRSHVLVQLFGGDWGYSYAIIDRRTLAANFYADAYRGIGPSAISKTTTIHYKAADGLDIPAKLTLPSNRDAQRLALIVLPHGGPFARDEPGFDWWSQALASRGYAVLQPQFRGSDGFGIAFLKAGYGEYGRKMQTDLSDGVADLVNQGVVDPARVAITGASYGGYAALAGVVLQSGVYRCAVAVAGPADMIRQMDFLREKSAGETRTPATRYWQEYLAIKDNHDPRLADLSLTNKADKVGVPVMLIHGRDDTVVPFDQSERMAAALKKAGKPVELVVLKGEDHWLSRSQTRLQMLTRSVAFLEACNPPG